MATWALIVGLGAIILLLSACGSKTAPTPVPLSLPESGPFELVAVPDASTQLEISSRLTAPSAGFVPLAFVANKSRGELGDVDVFEMGGRLYAAIVRNPGGYMLVDVTDPTQPTYLGAWKVNPSGSSEHLQAFRQGDRWHLALPFEAGASTPPTCAGLAIIEITDSENPVLRGVHNGSTTGASEMWCGVHSLTIIANEDGDAEHILVTSKDTFDLRVLDIRDLDNVQETNFYHLHVHPHGSRAWAHHMNVVDDRIYVSHWDGGVMILDRSALLSGGSSEQIELTSAGDIRAPDFGAHDAYPTTGGEFLFVNDAFLAEGGLRVFDIRDLANPRSIMTVDLEGLQTERHTILVQNDLLFVPWRAKGVRVFRYEFGQPDQPVLEPIAFQELRVHPIDRGAGGIAAIATHSCPVDGEMHTCVYASDASFGLIIMGLDET